MANRDLEHPHMMSTELLEAANHGNVESLRQLIHADPKFLLSRTLEGDTALHIAARLGHRALVKDILRQDVSLLRLRNAYGNTPLHVALQSGHVKIAALLANYAAWWLAVEDVSESPLRVPNEQGNTALHEAVIRRNVRIAQKLLDADPRMGHEMNNRKETPLHIAMCDGLEEVVEKILANPWIETWEESLAMFGTRSTLHQAVLSGHVKIVKMLLEKQPDFLKAVDESGKNALHYAAQLRDNKMMVEMLLKKENSQLAYLSNNNGYFPLHEAAFHGSSSAVKEILKYCPHTAEQVDSTGKNAIHIAVESGMVDTLKCLLKHIKSEEIINKADDSGNTPLHLAAAQPGVDSMLTLLKDERVNPCLLNACGQKARSIFESHGVIGTYVIIAWDELKKKEDEKCNKQHMPSAAALQPFQKDVALRYFEQCINTCSLIAALIATVTFAANFTMPGGFNQEHGTAILEKQLAFKVFVISNTVAMCSSLAVLFCFMWAWMEPTQFTFNQLRWGQRLMLLAFLTMLVTTMTAVHLVLTHRCRWLSIVVILIGCSTPVVVGLILSPKLLFAMMIK